MNVVQRVRDLCSANVHLALERLESPEAMLGQAIREMESDLSRSLHAAASLIALEKLLARRIAEHEAEIHSLEGRARKEVAAGRDTRARTAVGRRLDAERALAGLREQVELVTENRRTLRQQIDGLSEKLAEARRMRAALDARHLAASVCASPLGEATGVARFEQLRDRVEHAEAVAEARLALHGSLTRERTRDERDDEIEEELARLRRELPTV